MAIRLGDLVQITVNGVQSGQRVTNVLHYTPDGPADPQVTSAEIYLQTFRTNWRSEVLPVLVSGYTVLSYEAIVIAGTKAGPPDGPAKVLDLTDTAVLVGVPANDTGSGEGAPLPTYTTATFRKVTGLAGKRRRGSMRLRGIIQDLTETSDGNRLTAAGVTALQPVAEFLNSALAGLGTESLLPVVFSRKTLFEKDGAVNNVLDTFTIITGFLLNQIVGSQLSRKQVRSLGA